MNTGWAKNTGTIVPDFKTLKATGAAREAEGTLPPPKMGLQENSWLRR